MAHHLVLGYELHKHLEVYVSHSAPPVLQQFTRVRSEPMTTHAQRLAYKVMQFAEVCVGIRSMSASLCCAWNICMSIYWM